MPKVFSITTPRSEIVLGPGRKGSASYSVTNISDQPHRAQAVAHPRQPNTEKWFSVKDPLREFPVGRSTEVTVQVNVPPGAARGTYEVELDLVRDGPESLEDRTDQGQGVTFEVKGGAAFPWWILAVGAAVVVLVLAVVLLLKSTPPPVTPPVTKDGVVPQLSGLGHDQATAALEKAGLKVGNTSQSYDSKIPAGQIIMSNPPAGQVLPVGSPVVLVISIGPGSTSGSVERAPAAFSNPAPFPCGASGCPDGAGLELSLKSEGPYMAYLRFDFGADVPAGARLTKANLRLTVLSLISASDQMDLFISAAASDWKQNGGAACSQNFVMAAVDRLGPFDIDLTPVLVNDSANLLTYGLCITFKGSGGMTLASGGGGPEVAYPRLSVSYGH